MLRRAFVMQLSPDQHEEYQRRHSPIWDDLAEVLKYHGVHNYSIFLHPQTNQLFAYVEIEDEDRWAAISQTEVCRRWWTHMADIMETNDDDSPQATPLSEMFHFD